MTKTRHAWEVKVGNQTRDLLGDTWAARKRLVWILEMFWEQMMKYWESPKYKTFCEWNKRNRNERQGRGGRGAGKYTGGGSCNHERSYLYGAGSKAAHLRAETSRATAGLPPCYFEAEQRIMRQVEAVVSNVCLTFDEHIRWFSE
ncbi:hypothetical protein M9H77_14431 [Catharanthus roseus]|uniref:Uncharacterized protein n=1 Tax=Catharanthus roseus TaxID=4058 RepID=A0ACC0BNA4_CATRO|nr:hypothetical protein M9H77_14431 [Catharanthus roseus]